MACLLLGAGTTETAVPEVEKCLELARPELHPLIGRLLQMMAAVKSSFAAFLVSLLASSCLIVQGALWLPRLGFDICLQAALL